MKQEKLENKGSKLKKMRKFIFRIFPKFSPFPKTFLGNSPIFPIPLRKKFFGEMEALHPNSHSISTFHLHE